MKVVEITNYLPEFPERFFWGHLDSPKLAHLASILSTRILRDLETPNRSFVPGLRRALHCIAEIAEI